VLNCLLLMLLVLIQLPKKEAGAGLAFGGNTTDALFGAGSGNALTKLTKYTGTTFVALSIVLSVLHMQAANRGSRRIQQELSRQASAPAVTAPVLPTNLVAQPPAPANTLTASTTVTSSSATNLMSLTLTNPAVTTPSAPAAMVEDPAPAPAQPAQPESTPAEPATTPAPNAPEN
jgi:protein translocase SecG subunit